MKRALLGSAVSAWLALPGVAHDAVAQVPSGPYVAAGAGVSWLLEGNQPVFPMENSGLSTPSDHFRMGWDPGFTGTISVGWASGFGPRIEVEGVYRRYEADVGRGLVFSRRAGGGSSDSQTLMVNLLWDISMSWVGGSDRYLFPYVGGGVGYGRRRLSGVGGSAAGNRLSLDDNAEGPVYQLIAGLAFPLAWAGFPGLVAGVEYRHVMPDAPLLNAVVAGPDGTTRLAPVDVASHSHNLLFSIRYHF